MSTNSRDLNLNNPFTTISGRRHGRWWMTEIDVIFNQTLRSVSGRRAALWARLWPTHSTPFKWNMHFIVSFILGSPTFDSAGDYTRINLNKHSSLLTGDSQAAGPPFLQIHSLIGFYRKQQRPVGGEELNQTCLWDIPITTCVMHWNPAGTILLQCHDTNPNYIRSGSTQEFMSSNISISDQTNNNLSWKWPRACTAL